MSLPPPENLMDWPKRELVKELQRLRAITREHAEQVPPAPRRHSTRRPITSLDGDPYGQGNVVIDARGAVLMREVDVSLVDRKADDDELPIVMLVLAGRINYSTDESQAAYLFDTDGAAAICSELIGLAGRASGEFRNQFEADLHRRLHELP